MFINLDILLFVLFSNFIWNERFIQGLLTTIIIKTNIKSCLKICITHKFIISFGEHSHAMSHFYFDATKYPMEHIKHIHNNHY